ncbi:MAG: nucleotide exchange factor GrpE [Alphaproteobacteria bacterium]|nr:nucleotide exchange factor GrpE [Alphaproteobacteria bacterium]MBL6776326.1 nucleotide exchange factor GrpE [Alphaproteobacteria bacterium]
MTSETDNKDAKDQDIGDNNPKDKEQEAASEDIQQSASSEQLDAEDKIADLNLADIIDDADNIDDKGGENAADEDAAELKDQLLRLMADSENLRKRSERDVSAAKKYGALGLARDLLGSIDNLETAISHMPENKDDMDETLKNILIGVEMSARELASVLERHHIKKVTPEKEKFDYNIHQAMFEVPTDEVEPGMVVQVVQSGYMLHDRLLRPAMVGVSKAALPSEPEKTDG